MTNVKIVTDSNSGITQAEAEKLGIFVLPMPFLIDGEEYFEDVNLTQEAFYEYLKQDGVSISTSQPSVGSVTELWDKLLEDGSEILHIPMSSGLSESCHTAQGLAKEYGGRVHVVDNQRISVTQKSSVLDALVLKEQGLRASEIAERLTKSKLDASIYITLDTLKYLKKGGRLTPAAALIGSILRIKPVLQIQGEKLDAFKKVQTLRQAKSVMIEAIKHDLTTRFSEYVQNGEMQIDVVHTENLAEAERFREELQTAFPNVPVNSIDRLSLSVACHIGPGALACTCVRRLK